MVNLTIQPSIFRIGVAVLVVMVLGTLSAFGQGHIKFEKTRHDFGEVKEENGLVGTVFEFTNEGTKPLKVLSAKASCGCTTPIFSRDSILGGGKGKIKVEYNPMGRPGMFNKEILVETNGSPQFVSLTIHGKVTPRVRGPVDFYPFEEGSIRFKTNHLTYGSIFVDDTVTQSTILYNQGKKAIQFSKSSSKVPSHLKPKMTKTTLAPGDTLTLWVTYIASLKKDWGFAFDNIYLSTNDPERPMKHLNISAEIHEKFNPADKCSAPNLSLTKTLVDLGEVKEGDMPIAVFEFKNTGKSPLHVRKLTAACSCIEVTSNKVLEPGESGEIKLRFNSRGRIGEFEKDAELICNDPNQAVTTLQIKGTVVREGAAEGN